MTEPGEAFTLVRTASCMDPANTSTVSTLMSDPGEYGVASQMVSSEVQPTGGVKDVFSPSSQLEPALLALPVPDPDALDCDPVLDDVAPGASKLASSDGAGRPSGSKVRPPQASMTKAPNNDPAATVCTTEGV